MGDILTAVGIGLTFLASAGGLWIGIRNSKSSIFINSITTSRIKYIQELRNNISEFCGLFYSYHTLEKDKAGLSKEKLEILRSSDRLKYLIQLYLNPEDEYWDNKMIGLIDEIRSSIETNPTEKINELITITQYLLKLEWEGAKIESQKGILKKKEKDDLYRKYVGLYEQQMKKLSKAREHQTIKNI
jgi:hypothetical protein